MKCLLCENFSFKLICTKCLGSLQITPLSRQLDCGLKVYSFFEYSQIADLLTSKYSLIGSRIYAILAKICARYFFENDLLNAFSEFRQIAAIAIDDAPRLNYSHTAVIVQQFCKAQKKSLNQKNCNNTPKITLFQNLKLISESKKLFFNTDENFTSLGSENCHYSAILRTYYGALIAQNQISYAGKDLNFRNENPRNFKLLKTPHQDIAILFDDIITTGHTLTQAYEVLNQNGINTLFAITLADARF